MKRFFICLLFNSLLLTVAFAQQAKGFSIIEEKDRKQVNIFYNNKLMTAYCYYDSSRKPILYPVNTTDGITVTRSYPFQLIPGERTDHPHQTGIWFNYESVNNLDFWNNSPAIAPEKRKAYGTILHEELIDQKVWDNNAMLSVKATWIGPERNKLLNEKTTYHFKIVNNTFIIDRVTTLVADTIVVFKDVKDGLFAIRVARELEMPSKEKSSYVDDKGNITTLDASGASVTGMYYNSEGLKGDSVWGRKAKWVMLTGKKENTDITIGIIDHPLNVGYPSYWHARGYGLFAVNPLGRKIFSNGKEELNFTLQSNQSVTFRYRIVIHSGSGMPQMEMEKLEAEFAKFTE